MKLNPRLRAALGWLGVAAFWLGVWAVAACAVDLELLLPSPIRVVQRLGELVVTADFWRATLASFGRVALGALAALALGSLMAVGGALCPPLRRLMLPLLAIIKATPVASFILLALVWLERGILPAFMAALIVLPVVWGNLDAGIAAIDPALHELARAYHLPALRHLRRIYIPAVMPHFVSACRASLGMAWKAGIAAEVLCTPPVSMGRYLYETKLYLETTDLFAWTLTVILLSVGIEYVFMTVLEKATKKRRADHD
ncbi:MAG: ABC transporter permease subunit [Clostridia bacterium]|nr:ABC transporter permease subunit [Clostridia bacterium]